MFDVVRLSYIQMAIGPLVSYVTYKEVQNCIQTAGLAVSQVSIPIWYMHHVQLHWVLLSHSSRRDSTHRTVQCRHAQTDSYALWDHFSSAIGVLELLEPYKLCLLSVGQHQHADQQLG